LGNESQKQKEEIGGPGISEEVLLRKERKGKMKVIADLHMHSRYSRATSAKMNVNEVSRFAKIKGLSLVGTGDFRNRDG
jgi:hypothetical protein